MKRRYRYPGFALLLAAVLVLGFTCYVLIVKPTNDIGLTDDFTDVDLERVIAFAERSNAAYHDEKIFRHEYGAEVAAGEFPVSGLRIYVYSDPADKAQWVILRGTANMPNIVGDLDFIGRDEHELGIKVHTGFDTTLQECLPWIVERLDPQRPVWVTGHSLGGAVAALLVATLDHRGFQDVSGITFGQPKFTDAHGAKKLAHLRILRIVHDEDPVPMVPPAMVQGETFSTYVHFGPEIVVRANGHFRFLPLHNAARMNVARYWAEIRNIRPVRHDMTKGYLPALKLALKMAPQQVVKKAVNSDPAP